MHRIPRPPSSQEVSLDICDQKSMANVSICVEDQDEWAKKRQKAWQLEKEKRARQKARTQRAREGAEDDGGNDGDTEADDEEANDEDSQLVFGYGSDDEEYWDPKEVKLRLAKVVNALKNTVRNAPSSRSYQILSCAP